MLCQDAANTPFASIPLLMPEGSFSKAYASRAPKGSHSCFPLVLCCNKGRCGLFDLPCHHEKERKGEVVTLGLTPVCFFPLRWQNGCTPLPGACKLHSQARPSLPPSRETPQEGYFPLATPIYRRKLLRESRTPLSTLAAHQPGSGSMPQSPWKWSLHWGPLASASPFPLLAALHFRGLETQNTAVRGDLSEENGIIHSQEEAQGRSCNWFLI